LSAPAAIVQPILEPNAEEMLAHLQHLFGGELDGTHDGQIEISWTDARPAADGRHPLAHAQLFGTDQLEEAVALAVEKNRVPNQNVFVGAALRHPSTAPFGRARDDDFYAATANYCDLDDAGAAEAAIARYEHCRPTLAVITGKHPYLRAQLWWRLEAPERNPLVLREHNLAIARHLDGDTSVVNPSRVMRLAGSVAWPLKEGRVLEQTCLAALAEGRPRAYPPGAVAKAFMNGHAHPAASAGVAMPAHTTKPATVPATALGLGERIADGRESYARDTVLACLIEFIGTTGACPTPDELFDLAWPQYSAKVDFSRPGRGPDELRSKCAYAVQRFEAGRIRGARTLDEAAASYQAKRRVEDDSAEERLASPLPIFWFSEIEPNLNAMDFVESLLGFGQMSVVYGESNCGKTFFMTDLAMHIAWGQPWRGRAIDPGGVVYVALEGGFGIKNRVVAFRKHHRLIGVNLPFAVVPSSINLLDPNADANRLIELIKHAAEQIEKPIRMVVIDTLSRALAGGNENSSEDMGKLVINADRIRQATGAHLCFVHHSGKDQAKGARGHSSLRAAVDTEIEIVRDKEASFSIATVEKQREMEIEGEFGFSLEQVQLGINQRAKLVTSCVVVEHEIPTLKAGEQIRLTDLEYGMLREIRELINRAEETIALVPERGMQPVISVTREVLRAWLIRRGKLDVTDGVTAISNAERQRLFKLLNALSEKGKIGVSKDHVWLL
jgi:hypothetical protein